MMRKYKLSEVENTKAKREEASHQPNNCDDPAVRNSPVIFEEQASDYRQHKYQAREQ